VNIIRISMILCVSICFTVSGYVFALPIDHTANGLNTGWCCPLGNKEIAGIRKTPIETITLGLMSYYTPRYPYHYGQDIGLGASAGDNVYGMADGAIWRVRKTGGYGGYTL